MTVGKVTLRSSDRRHTLTTWLGPNQPTISGGVGGWSEIQRPRKPGVVEWTGTAPLKGSLELFLDGWGAARNINAELGVLRALAPMRPSTQPPVFYVLGCAQIPSTVPWTANGLDLSDWVLRASDGQPSRVTATVSLIEYRIGDVVTRSSPAKRSKDRNGSGSKGKARTYTVRRGDTLGGIAAKTLGSASKWTALAKANGLRDPNKLKVGQVLKLPTS